MMLACRRCGRRSFLASEPRRPRRRCRYCAAGHGRPAVLSIIPHFQKRFGGQKHMPPENHQEHPVCDLSTKCRERAGRRRWNLYSPRTRPSLSEPISTPSKLFSYTNRAERIYFETPSSSTDCRTTVSVCDKVVVTIFGRNS